MRGRERLGLAPAFTLRVLIMRGREYLRCGTSAYTVSTLRVVLRKGRDPDGGAIEPGCDGDHSSHKSKIVCKEKSTQKPALSPQNSCCGLHK